VPYAPICGRCAQARAAGRSRISARGAPGRCRADSWIAPRVATRDAAILPAQKKSYIGSYRIFYLTSNIISAKMRPHRAQYQEINVGYAAERLNKPAGLRPASMVDNVYEHIYHKLMALEIAPGARIPIDVLAREMGVSQTPVREALNRLEREGLVRKEHLIGYSAAPQWTRKQFEDLYAFRLLLEPQAARLAAQNMTPQALESLERSAADMGHGE